MTTDTALAKISLDEQIAYQREPWGSGEHEAAILATLQSIKDAGDDVVEPVRDEYECYDHYVDALKDYADHLLSAYKRACVERDAVSAELREVRKVTDMLLLCGEDECRDLKGAEKLRSLIDGLIVQRRRAEKAEAEREQFRKDAERIEYLEKLLFSGHEVFSQSNYVRIENASDLVAKGITLREAIDSARNK